MRIFFIVIRTKFDLNVLPVETDTHLRIRQMSLDLSSPNHIPLNVRIAEFCEDPQNMDEMTAFIDDILKKAQIEADARLEEKNKVVSLILSFRFLYLMKIFLFLQTDMKKNGRGNWQLYLVIFVGSFIVLV